MVFLGNTARYSVRDGVFQLPLVRRFCQKREPRSFYLSVGVISLLSLVCFVAVSGYVVKVALS
jgi:hypothetical protein